GALRESRTRTPTARALRSASGGLGRSTKGDKRILRAANWPSDPSACLSSALARRTDRAGSQRSPCGAPGLFGSKESAGSLAQPVARRRTKNLFCEKQNAGLRSAGGFVH